MWLSLGKKLKMNYHSVSVYNAYNNGAGFNRIFTVQLYLTIRL